MNDAAPTKKADERIHGENSDDEAKALPELVLYKYDLDASKPRIVHARFPSTIT